MTQPTIALKFAPVVPELDLALASRPTAVAEFAAAYVGPRGLAGDAITLVVGAEALSGHSAVAVDAAGLLIKADCTSAAQRGAVLGLLAGAYSPGDQAVVQTAYTLEHAGWTWVPGPVFVGASGQLVQTLPVGAVFSQVVAQALSATLVLVDVQPPVNLV